MILRDDVDAPTRVGAYGPGLVSTKIMRHKKLLVQLHAVQANLSFAKLTMQRLLHAIAVGKPWKLTGEEVKDFASKGANRIRGMCRHLSQSILKPIGRSGSTKC